MNYCVFYVVANYTERQTHGLCATALLIGDVVREYSTVRRQPVVVHPSCSVKLIGRTKKFIEHELLVLKRPAINNILFVASICPVSALQLSYRYQNQRPADQGNNNCEAPEEEQAKVGAFYYNNESTHQVLHEMKSYTSQQPNQGWRVETCRVNVTYSTKMVCVFTSSLPDHYCVWTIQEIHWQQKRLSHVN